MCKNVSVIVGLILILWSGGVWAFPIEIENYSFELPGTVKTLFDQSGSVPGWTEVDLTTEGGVEQGYQPTDGVWAGFMGNHLLLAH
jgi:hypothetical protein